MSGTAEHTTPLTHALDQLTVALKNVIKLTGDGALEDLDASEVVEFAQDWETLRRQMPLVDHAMIAAAMAKDVPERLCQRSMVRVLTSVLRISAGEASRRVRAAERLGPRRSMTGVELPVLRPALAAAQRQGEISAEQVGVIDRELRRVEGRGFDPADLDAGEQILVDAARALPPEALRGVAVRVVDAIDPDGTVPDDLHQEARRFFHLRSAPDGSFRGDFRLTPEVGQELTASRHVTFETRSSADGEGLEPEFVGEEVTVGPSATGDAACSADPAARRRVEPDDRTREQRLHDAVGQLCDRMLRSGTLPDTGGVPVTVLNHHADDLAERAGHGTFADGTAVSASQVAKLADQAGVAWCVRGSSGAILSFGRSQRLASRGQTLALAARDGGCSFPGCDVEPSWCERHHVVSWIDGGPTDLTNLTLVCRYHHHHVEQRGWRCRIAADGVPAWIPPRRIDRDQRPIVNTRIRLRHRRGRSLLTAASRGAEPP